MQAPTSAESFSISNLLRRQLIDRLLDLDDDVLFRKLLTLENRREQGIITHSDYSTQLHNISKSLGTQGLSADAPQTLLVARNLSKVYKSFALGPIDLELQTSQMVGLVGENGNGKTTLLRMLAQDLSISSGTIEYPNFGYPSQYDLRSHIPYIPQRTPRWYGPVRDNLVFCALMYGTSPERVDTLVEIWMLRFGIWQFREHDWSALSSGYKMRFELVRAFLRNPRLLVIDEPLANLDVLAQQLILEDLHMLSRSRRYPRGIILSSQQLYNVESAADYVIFLKDGKIVNLPQKATAQATECVIEIESNLTADSLKSALDSQGRVEVEEHGSSYLVHVYQEGIKAQTLLKTLVDLDTEITYFRDITHSARRLFTQNPTDENA